MKLSEKYPYEKWVAKYGVIRPMNPYEKFIFPEPELNSHLKYRNMVHKDFESTCPRLHTSLPDGEYKADELVGVWQKRSKRAKTWNICGETEIAYFGTYEKFAEFMKAKGGFETRITVELADGEIPTMLGHTEVEQQDFDLLTLQSILRGVLFVRPFNIDVIEKYAIRLCDKIVEQSESAPVNPNVFERFTCSGTERHAVDQAPDFAGNYFESIHQRYAGNKVSEVEHFHNSDASVSFFIVDDKVQACVFERRTAFNHIEVMYCERFINPNAGEKETVEYNYIKPISHKTELDKYEKIRDSDISRDSTCSPLHDAFISAICDRLHEYGAKEHFDSLWTSSLFPERLAKQCLRITEQFLSTEVQQLQAEINRLTKENTSRKSVLIRCEAYFRNCKSQGPVEAEILRNIHALTPSPLNKE